MSPFPKSQKWLKNSEAAELLAVDERTIKRWMIRSDTREALEALRHGKQWRIPRPDNPEHWRSDTRWRFKKLGIQLPTEWKRALRKIAKRNARCYLEGCRLWLAALLKVLAQGSITQEDKLAVGRLYQAARKILAPLPQPRMQSDKLKARFPAELLSRPQLLAALRYCSANRCTVSRIIAAALLDVYAVMRYWPEEKHFKPVRAARTLGRLEAIRRRLDYTQAVCELKQRGQKPTTENIRPLLHNGMVAHINDTREQLRGDVLRHPRPEEMKRIALASVCDAIAGKKPPLLTLDFRLPQVGLKRRSAQKLYPQRKQTQRDVRAIVYGVAPAVPGVEEPPETGKTPVRGSAYRKRDKDN